MKRRTFIQSLLALVAAPVVAKIPVEEAKPKLPDGFKVYKGYTDNTSWFLSHENEPLYVGDLVIKKEKINSANSGFIAQSKSIGKIICLPEDIDTAKRILKGIK